MIVKCAGSAAESLKSAVLSVVNFEKIDQSGQFQQGLHPLVDVDKLHLATRLPDDAVAAGQFAQAIAVHEIHAGQVDEELFAAVAGKYVHKVAQLGAAVTQRQPAHTIHHHNAIEFSSLDLERHSWVAAGYSAGIISSVELAFKSSRRARRRSSRSLWAAVPGGRSGGFSDALGPARIAPHHLQDEPVHAMEKLRSGKEHERAITFHQMHALLAAKFGRRLA